MLQNQNLWTEQSRATSSCNFNIFHVFICPEALALLNPICWVVTGVPATGFSLSYFLSLSTVWAFSTDVCSLRWLVQPEWWWLIMCWHGWQSVRGMRQWQVDSNFLWKWMRKGKSEGWLGKHQQHWLELQLLTIRKGKRYSNPNSNTIKARGGLGF